MSSKPPKSPLLLARCAQTVIAAAAILDVFRAIELRNRFLHPTDANRHTSALMSQIFIYGIELAIVLFLVGLARVRRNAQALSPQANVPTPGWTIGAWFTPLVNLFVPRQFVLDIGRASPSAWQEPKDRTLVNLWWAAWLGHMIALLVTGNLVPGSLALLVVAETCMLAAAGLVGVVIERISTLQSATLGASVPVSPVAPA
ncbi:DUF4328 domain-containing protein [Actinacidiphila glaucinigra]|uniref:DUF4328 domain-containing protein n=1 Tax=Actinacidiphila glaucinigra TaxID=235986 RepID=UPI002DDB8C65|nr:DUF4328 domain-containing protein [Actinacidiphila glaucinigra]WSD64120.1 DUF4328 domain-containing protein [Actinacidiphila glaucinigra]